MSCIRGPNIVTNGLVLCLDAGNPKSYGTNWTDLNSAHLISTPVNTPTLTSSNAGYYSFNGVDQAFNINGRPLNNLPQGTVSIWFKTNAFNGGTLLYEDGSGFNNFSISIAGSTSGTVNAYIGSNVSLPGVKSSWVVSTWYELCVTWGNSFVTHYVNGVLDTSISSSSYIHNAGGAWDQISRYGYGGTTIPNTVGSYFNGDIGAIKIYQTILSASEVLRNFNAVRGRYGL